MRREGTDWVYCILLLTIGKSKKKLFLRTSQLRGVTTLCQLVFLNILISKYITWYNYIIHLLCIMHKWELFKSGVRIPGCRWNSSTPTTSTMEPSGGTRYSTRWSVDFRSFYSTKHTTFVCTSPGSMYKIFCIVCS